MKSLIFSIAVLFCIIGCANNNIRPSESESRYDCPEYPKQFEVDKLNEAVWHRYTLYDDELKENHTLNYRCSGVLGYSERVEYMNTWRWLQISEESQPFKTSIKLYKYSEPDPKKFEKITAYRVRYALNGKIFHRYTFECKEAYSRTGDTNKISFYDAKTGNHVTVNGQYEVLSFYADISKESRDKIDEVGKQIKKRNEDIDKWEKGLPTKWQKTWKKYRNHW